MTTPKNINTESINLNQLLRTVQQEGELILMQNGQPVARLTALADISAAEISAAETSTADTSTQQLPLADLVDDPMDAEIHAFEQQHPQLIQTHLHQYVAIYQQQLIDADMDEQLLLTRLAQTHPEQIVLIRQVQEILPAPLRVRSPRLKSIS